MEALLWRAPSQLLKSYTPNKLLNKTSSFHSVLKKYTFPCPLYSQYGSPASSLCIILYLLETQTFRLDFRFTESKSALNKTSKYLVSTSHFEKLCSEWLKRPSSSIESGRLLECCLRTRQQDKNCVSAPDLYPDPLLFPPPASSS